MKIERMCSEKEAPKLMDGNRKRSVGLSLVGWFLVGSVAAALPACEEKNSGFEEAVEEIEDETKDAKDEIRDEIDDHS